MAVVSDDHADESFNVAHLASPVGHRSAEPRSISPAEVKQHNGQQGASFWAVIDGFVVDASEFVDTHPGGLKKLLSTDAAGTGATGESFGFSFSRGRNAHFPETGKSFSDGVKKFLGGSADGPFLAPAEVQFGRHGTVVILGRLAR